MDHPDVDSWLDFIERTTPAVELAQIEAHLAVCVICRSIFEGHARIHELSREIGKRVAHGTPTLSAGLARRILATVAGIADNDGIPAKAFLNDGQSRQPVYASNESSQEGHGRLKPGSRSVGQSVWRETKDIAEEARRLVSQGNVEAAAKMILSALGPEVFGLLITALGDDANAEEVFAEVGECVLRSLAAFHWRSSVRTWLYCIARNEMARFLRGSQRRTQERGNVSELEGLIAAVRTATHSVSYSVSRSDEADRLKAFRDELSIEDRIIIVLRIDRRLRWKEIARVVLGTDEGVTLEELKRETLRLRKRFMLIAHRLRVRVRAGKAG
jgi:RNA polymerase sigma-70 factor, ECF subfamily